MTVLSAQTILRMELVRPCLGPYVCPSGNSAGLSACGYDLTLEEAVLVRPGEFVLAAAAELLVLPPNVVGMVHDKSSLARRGLAVQNTVAEPGWHGYLTLELTNHSPRPGLGGRISDWMDHCEPAGTIRLPAGAAVCQIVFHLLDEATERPYRGKYQDQAAGPQPSRGYGHVDTLGAPDGLAAGRPYWNKGGS